MLNFDFYQICKAINLQNKNKINKKTQNVLKKGHTSAP